MTKPSLTKRALLRITTLAATCYAGANKLQALYVVTSLALFRSMRACDSFVNSRTFTQQQPPFPRPNFVPNKRTSTHVSQHRADACLERSSALPLPARRPPCAPLSWSSRPQSSAAAPAAARGGWCAPSPCRRPTASPAATPPASSPCAPASPAAGTSMTTAWPCSRRWVRRGALGANSEPIP